MIPRQRVGREGRKVGREGRRVGREGRTGRSEGRTVDATDAEVDRESERRRADIEAAHPHRPTRRPNTISPFLLLKLYQSLQICNSVPYEPTKPPESSSDRTIDDGPDFSRQAAGARRRPEEDRCFSYSLLFVHPCRDRVLAIANAAVDRRGRPPVFGRSSPAVGRA